MRKLLYAFVLVTAYIWPTHAIFANLDIAQSSSDSNASYTVAGIYWLPDYLKDNVDTNQRSETDKGGGDLTGGTCEQTYGLSSSCPAPQIIKKTHNLGKIICYECQCPSSYQYSSCNTGYVLAGGSCNGKYLRCDAASCPSGYTAGLTCGTGYNREVNGKSGTADCAKCTVKACASGYTAGLANCNGQSQPSGWSYSSNGYSGSSICGKCSAKTCASGFTAGVANCNGQSQPSGWTHSSNGYSGNSICGKCTAKTCPSGFSAGVTSCSDTSSWTYGSNGYAGNSICGKCSAKACDTGYTAGLDNCNAKTYPAGWTHSTGTASGSTVCGKCTAKSCAAGSTSCNSSTQNATANGYYAGDAICYTCTNKTCEQMGQKTCNGSCIATSECCGGCPTGQTCQNGTCVNNKTPEQICEEKGYALNTYCDEYQARFYNYCPENKNYTSCYQDCEKFYNNAVAAINGYNSAINNGKIYYDKCGNNISKCTDTITYRGVTYKYFTLDYNYVCVTKYNEVKKYFNNAIAYCSRTVPIAYECPPRGMACNNYGYMVGSRELIIGTEACCCSCRGDGTPNGECYGGGSIFPVNPTGTGGGTSTT